MKCGAEDKDEICIARGCYCHCHDTFWASYDQLAYNAQEEAQEEN
jgi:hypothetical protein